MGRHLDAIVPLFLKFLGEPADEALQNEATSELRETCLQVFFFFLTFGSLIPYFLFAISCIFSSGLDEHGAG